MPISSKECAQKKSEIDDLKFFLFFSVTNWMCVTLQKVGKSFFLVTFFIRLSRNSFSRGFGR